MGSEQRFLKSGRCRRGGKAGKCDYGRIVTEVLVLKVEEVGREPRNVSGH